MIKSTQALLLLIAIVTSTMARGDDAANAAARGVDDAFMTAFNAKDSGRGPILFCTRTCDSPGKVTTFPTARRSSRQNHIDALIAGEGWDHSKWDSLTILQSSPTKVHIAVEFRAITRTAADTRATRRCTSSNRSTANGAFARVRVLRRR